MDVDEERGFDQHPSPELAVADDLEFELKPKSRTIDVQEEDVRALHHIEAKLEMIARMREKDVGARKLTDALESLESQQMILFNVLSSGQVTAFGFESAARVERIIEQVDAEIAQLHAYVAEAGVADADEDLALAEALDAQLNPRAQSIRQDRDGHETSDWMANAKVKGASEQETSQFLKSYKASTRTDYQKFKEYRANRHNNSFEDLARLRDKRISLLPLCPRIHAGIFQRVDGYIAVPRCRDIPSIIERVMNSTYADAYNLTQSLATRIAKHEYTGLTAEIALEIIFSFVHRVEQVKALCGALRLDLYSRNTVDLPTGPLKYMYEHALVLREFLVKEGIVAFSPGLALLSLGDYRSKSKSVYMLELRDGNNAFNPAINEWILKRTGFPAYVISK